MDFIERALSEANGIRIFYADVSNTAATLERRHLSGPTAGRVLGEAVTSVALLSADLKSDDESISLQLKSDGPIGGVMVDANGSGNLRGYTHKKILSDFDGDEMPNLDAVMGNHGQIAVIRSSSFRVLSVGQVAASPPRLRTALARYYNNSQQTPTAVELHTTSRDGYLKRAVGIVADRMPGGSHEAFCDVLERFNSGAVYRFLNSSTEILDFEELFGLADIKSVGRRDVRFACHCSYEKISDAVSTLPDDEIREILSAGHGQRVTCDFCGELYTVREETLREILENSQSSTAPTESRSAGDETETGGPDGDDRA